MAEEFLEGASSVVMGALVVGFTRAILVILQGAMIIDTIVFTPPRCFKGMPPIIAAQGMLILQTLINFFIPSSTGRAATVIPILAPLGRSAGSQPAGNLPCIPVRRRFLQYSVAHMFPCHFHRYQRNSNAQVVEVFHAPVRHPIYCAGTDFVSSCFNGNMIFSSVFVSKEERDSSDNPFAKICSQILSEFSEIW